MNFLERIDDLIKAKGITRNILTKELEINHGVFYGWETRGTIPSGAIIAKIAKYFNVSTDYLLGLTNHQKPNKPPK